MALPATSTFTGADGTTIAAYSASWTSNEAGLKIYSNSIRDNNGSKAKNPYDKKNFTYYPERDEFRCPMSQTVTFTGELKQFEQEKQKIKKNLTS